MPFARARDQFPGGRRVESESERLQVQVGALIRTQPLGPLPPKPGKWTETRGARGPRTLRGADDEGRGLKGSNKQREDVPCYVWV